MERSKIICLWLNECELIVDAREKENETGAGLPIYVHAIPNARKCSSPLTI